MTSLLKASVTALGLLVSVSACAGGSTQESTGQYIDSAAITAKVQAALARDEQISVFDVDVETFRDVVQLSGFVDSPAARARAGQIAREVNGVREVKNTLQIKKSGA